MKIAFLGLGPMGAPMAARLADAGHELCVWNRSAEKATPFAARGARLATTPPASRRGRGTGHHVARQRCCRTCGHTR